LEFFLQFQKEKGEKWMHEDCFVPKNYHAALQLHSCLFWWKRNETIVNHCWEHFSASSWPSAVGNREKAGECLLLNCSPGCWVQPAGGCRDHSKWGKHPVSQRNKQSLK
jgi:hypothetical protein